MKPVDQTKFGGINAPVDEQGNCWQAAVASVLEIPLEEAFDVRQHDQGELHWWGIWLAWLAGYGLGCLFFPWNEATGPGTEAVGYHMAETESMTLKNGETHVVVLKDGEVVHDPNAKAEAVGKIIGVYMFVPLDVAIVARAARTRQPAGREA